MNFMNEFDILCSTEWLTFPYANFLINIFVDKQLIAVYELFQAVDFVHFHHVLSKHNVAVKRWRTMVSLKL